MAAMVLGSLLFLADLVFEVQKYAATPASMTLRTQLFEPRDCGAGVALAGPGCDTGLARTRGCCHLLAVSLIVFGVDHFLALAPIGTLIPPWIPWHVFWIAFFGAAFVALRFKHRLQFLPRYGAACVGLMFATWVFTLHLPRVVGLVGGSGPHSPAEWSSLFIAIALWGGP